MGEIAMDAMYQQAQDISNLEMLAKTLDSMCKVTSTEMARSQVHSTIDIIAGRVLAFEQAKQALIDAEDSEDGA